MIAVDDDDVAAGDLGGDVAQPDHRGDAHGAGDDGGVAGAPAGVGGEALHVLRSSAAVWLGSRSWAMTTTSLVEMRQIQLLLADQPLEQLPSRCRERP